MKKLLVLSLLLATACGPTPEARFAKVCKDKAKEDLGRQACECIAKKLGDDLPSDQYNILVDAAEGKKIDSDKAKIMANSNANEVMFKASMSCATAVMNKTK